MKQGVRVCVCVVYARNFKEKSYGDMTTINNALTQTGSWTLVIAKGIIHQVHSSIIHNSQGGSSASVHQRMSG